LRVRGGHLEIVKMIAEGRDAEIFALDDGRVLRLLRTPATQEMAEREAAALTAVRSVIPNVPAVTRTVQVAGRPGIVMDFIEGIDLMKRLGTHPWSLFTVARITGQIHARINSIAAPASLPRLRDFLRRRIESIDRVSEKLTAAVLFELENLPDGDALCHGDFQVGNIIVLADNEPVVIDWADATRGDADADFARTSVMMVAGDLPRGTPWLVRYGSRAGRNAFGRAYRSAYQRVRRSDLNTLRRWELVRAFDRLADNIPEERNKLLKIVRSRMSDLVGCAV